MEPIFGFITKDENKYSIHTVVQKGTQNLHVFAGRIKGNVMH